MGPKWEKLRPFEQLLLDDSSGTNACIINAVFNIEGEICGEWAVEHVASRLVTHPRFASLVQTRRGRSKFTPVPGFAEDREQIASHVKTHAPSVQPPSCAALDALLSEELRLDRPLWELHVFPGSNGTPSAIVFRLHHCVADGVGLVRFFLSTVADGPPGPAPFPTSRLPPRSPLHGRLVVRGLISIPRALRFVVSPLRDILTVFVNPLIPDAPSVFNSTIRGTYKRAVFARPYPLAELATCARLIGVSINDLTLTAVVGALREYAFKQGNKPRDLRRFHMGIPINRHPPDQHVDTVVNALSVLPLRAPTLCENRLDRLALCTERMRRMKDGLQPRFAQTAYRVVRALPQFGRIPLWRRITRVSSALFTNLAGPAGKLQVGGREVCNIRVLAPSQGNAGTTFSAISYAGMFNFGFSCDARQVPEPEIFADLFNRELDSLLEWIRDLKRDSVA